jgi:hypothetical protein
MKLMEISMDFKEESMRFVFENQRNNLQIDRIIYENNHGVLYEFQGKLHVFGSFKLKEKSQGFSFSSP